MKLACPLLKNPFKKYIIVSVRQINPPLYYYYSIISERNDLMKNEMHRPDARTMIRTAAPIVTALFLFLVSAGYIAYRMISNYNYNERWKDYDECGLS